MQTGNQVTRYFKRKTLGEICVGGLVLLKGGHIIHMYMEKARGGGDGDVQLY
jgi:hypothetical protein